MIEEKSYAKALNDRKLLNKGIPYKGGIELTYQCNLRCLHCATSCKFKNKRELNTKELLKILDDISLAGCLWLTLTGGEALTRKDFWEIYRYAKNKGFLITVLTNATLINKKVIEEFKKTPPYQIQVSILGRSKEVYETVSGVKGSFERFKNGLTLLIKSGLRIGMVRMPLLTVNKSQLFEARDYVKSLGLEFDYYPYIDPTLTNDDSVMKYSLSLKELMELERLDGWAARWQEDMARCRNNAPTTYYCLKEREYRTFAINAFGEFDVKRDYPCIPLVFPLTKVPFLSAWDKFLEKAVDLTDSYQCDCKKCGLFLLCFQCLTHMRLKERGSAFKQYHCQIAQARFSMLENYQ